jgi:hypothetical protein
LTEQRHALKASCDSYDSGNEWEAARLATTIFTLLHDGGSIKSVLTRLGLKTGLRFISTGDEYDPKNLMTHMPLVAARIETTASGTVGKAIPIFEIGESPQRRNQFPTWWEKESIYHDSGLHLTRRRLVFALRHQDGGGHVGELTDESYVRIKTKSFAFAFGPNQPDQPMYAMTASMRQIAWEVMEVLDQLGDVT